MLALFREEVRTHVDAMMAGFLDLEQEPNNPRTIEPLMRAAHTLKGACRIVGIDAGVHLTHEVDMAVDGADGWNKVRTGNYDLVVSDVDMPRMTGLEFVRRIRDDARLKELPVVIVSYKDREEDRMRGLEAGANCYLVKSNFHDDSFVQSIVDLIGV